MVRIENNKKNQGNELKKLILLIKMYIFMFKARGRKFKNPLGKGKMRNKLCICGADKKVKDCHGRNATLSPKEFYKLSLIIQANAEKMEAARQFIQGTLGKDIRRMRKELPNEA